MKTKPSPRKMRPEPDYVEIAIVRCPRCRSARYKTLRTLEVLRDRRDHNATVAVTRRTACANCGHKFIVISG